MRKCGNVKIWNLSSIIHHLSSYFLHPASYFLPLTSYLLLPTSYFLLLTSCPLPLSSILHLQSTILHPLLLLFRVLRQIIFMHYISFEFVNPFSTTKKFSFDKCFTGFLQNIANNKGFLHIATYSYRPMICH